MARPEATLRDATEDDLAFLSQLAGEESVAAFLMPGGGERDRFAALLELGRRERGPCGLFVIEAGGRAVGALALEPVSERSRICQLSALMVDPGARRAGVASTAVRLACRRALLDHGWHRVQAETYGDNIAGQRLFERARFVREGTRRRAYWRREQWLDGVLFGILADELEPSGDDG